jgi:hypothetical protein
MEMAFTNGSVAQLLQLSIAFLLLCDIDVPYHVLMTPPKDIIELVNELLHEGARVQSDGDRIRYRNRTGDHFKTVGQALLDRDEKLKIAVEALDSVGTCTHPYPDGFCNCDSKTAKQALARIHSIPPTK